MPDAVVVGAGFAGLSTAVRLTEVGWRVRIVAERPPAGSTSQLAAAIWFPTRVGPRERVLGWGGSTYRVLADQAADGVPGVVMRESLALYRQPPEPPWWAGAVGGVRAAEPGELPPGYRYGLRFVVPLVEMPVHLPWLLARFESGGGTLTGRRLGEPAQLAELGRDADLVVNCSGLGARELAGDPSVVPVRGQIVRVRNPGLSMSVRDEGHPAGRAYVHPRDTDCILGGTLEENNWDTAPDPATSASIVARCLDLAPALRGVEVLEHIVGLRPARPTVRLERDQVQPRLLHNYGHGGAGITLGWGCAEEIVALAGSR